MVFPLSDLKLIQPELTLLVFSCIVLLFDVFATKRYKFITYLIAQVSLIITFILLGMQLDAPVSYTFHQMFVIDSVGTLLKLAMTGSVFFVLLYARPYLKDKKIATGEFYLLSLFSLLGMMILVSANNILLLYLGLEFLTLPMIALVALQRDSANACEAAIKFFVMSALASGILLYGLSILYGITKSLDIPTIAKTIPTIPDKEDIVLLLSLVFVVIGIVFKIGAVPFHMWVPDVYAGAPNPVTLFVSTAPKIAGVGMLIRLLIDAMPSLQIEWQEYLIVIAVLSIALGNVVAIAQTNIKRMLAYSSIAHMGYMSLGFIAATPIGYASSVFYIIVYSIMALGSFAVLVLMSHYGIEIENIEDLRGLNSRNPWLAFMLMLILFSMAGIPPLAGFFAKIGVLEALIGVQLVWLAVYALVFAIIGAYYYINVVKVMYFDEPKEATSLQYSMDSRLAISLNGLIVLFLGLVPGWLFTLCQHVFGMS